MRSSLWVDAFACPRKGPLESRKRRPIGNKLVHYNGLPHEKSKQLRLQRIIS